jgi:ArsR family transcriptional regulator, lead/cadmium/zinc/bismuth-responsive transcriptional repressor
MRHQILDEHSAAHVAELFRSFSDTSRVMILSALLDGEKNVKSLAGLVGVSESAISHHMRGLRQMRLVATRREGKEVYYRLEDPHIVALFKQGIEHVSSEERPYNRSRPTGRTRKLVSAQPSKTERS